jgi:hypothetical protein
MNVEIGTEAAKFLFCEYINPNFFAGVGIINGPRNNIKMLPGKVVL